MNWKTCFLPLLLAAVMLGSVTAFADGEPAAPETTEPTEIASRETEGSWSGDTYTDAQGIVYELNGDGTITLTNGTSAAGSITIPEAIEKGEESYSVTSVENRAFIFCDTLTAVTFSGNVGSIGDNAFYGCGALESVTLSGNVGSVGYYAFAVWGALKSVTFSGNIDSIGDEAFSHCFDLKNVTFSGDVDSIEDFAFWACTALKTLTFSGDVRSIEYGAFLSCSALNTVTFSGDVGSIDDSAFYNCTALTTIYVPNMSDEKIDMIETALDRSGLSSVKIERSAPEQPSDPDPDTPSDPATGTPSDPATGTPSAPSTGTTSTGSAVQQLEAAERPDPMDVEATERYNFWMDVKSDLRAAGDGRTVRVYVPADYTNMPASVMETIRTLGKEITIDLRWNGQRLIITPQTALQRPARKAFWTFDALCEVYAR